MTHEKLGRLPSQEFHIRQQLTKSLHHSVLLFWQILDCQTKPFVKRNGKGGKLNSVRFYSLLLTCQKAVILAPCKLSVLSFTAHVLSYSMTPKTATL